MGGVKAKAAKLLHYKCHPSHPPPSKVQAVDHYDARAAQLGGLGVDRGIGCAGQEGTVFRLSIK
ncbi:hypothetical protein [Synechococcus sp. 1G10]|uniref:hypothetical protein n=1 Tax=Synechococcus sp. 1G10 TaxID=2025605 RepID=UPI000B991A99|nr:hypothetical protein [Synechococcus sp. 1G10]